MIEVLALANLAKVLEHSARTLFLMLLQKNAPSSNLTSSTPGTSCTWKLGRRRPGAKERSGKDREGLGTMKQMNANSQEPEGLVSKY